MLYLSRHISQHEVSSARSWPLVPTPSGTPENNRSKGHAVPGILYPGCQACTGLLSSRDSHVVSTQVLPSEALVTDAGEVTEMGKAYVPPRVLQEALCVISGVPGIEGDIANTEQLAREMLIISHHPSLGLWPRLVGRGRGSVGQGESRLGRRFQRALSPSVAVQSGLWPALLAKMKIDPEAFITRHLDQIIPRITTQSPLNQVMHA